MGLLGESPVGRSVGSRVRWGRRPRLDGLPAPLSQESRKWQVRKPLCPCKCRQFV